MKSMNPYLNFAGNCRQAMSFYQKCLGGELHLMPMSEAPEQMRPQADPGQIMHARLHAGPVTIMASDCMPGQPLAVGNNVRLSLDCESVSEMERIFNALSSNGKVTMPLQDTFWGARFGMLTDQFGINWMFNCEKKA